jgi:hypothetical protein
VLLTLIVDQIPARGIPIPYSGSRFGPEFQHLSNLDIGGIGCAATRLQTSVSDLEMTQKSVSKPANRILGSDDGSFFDWDRQTSRAA